MIPSPEFVPDVLSHRLAFRPHCSLNGTWQFRRDPDNRGATEGWHAGDGAFGQTVHIPGVPQAQGIGEPHIQQKTRFDEPFWVRKRFSPPMVGSRERLWLRIGGILPAEEVYLDGECVGYTKSSRTQQRVDVSRFVRPDAENLLAIKVCQQPEVRLDGIWEYAESGFFCSGVYGPVSCEVTHALSVADLYVQPQLSASSASVWIALDRPCDEALAVNLRVLDDGREIGGATASTSSLRTLRREPCSNRCSPMRGASVSDPKRSCREGSSSNGSACARTRRLRDSGSAKGMLV